MPGTIEFDRLVSYFDADLTNLRAGYKQADRLYNAFEKRVRASKNLTLDVTPGKGFDKTDALMRRAEADIARMQRQTAAGEAALTRQITREAEAQFRAKTRSYQRAVQDNIRFSRQQAALEARNSGSGVLATAGAGASRILGGVGITGTAVAYGISRSAIEVDNLQNSLNAATGSIEKGRAKLEALNEVAKASPGILLDTAVSTYALLRPMGLAEPTIYKLIQAFGRIKLALPTADINQFAFNLNQLAVSFDQPDFKQAVEAFPRFGEIVKKAFNLKSAQDDIEGLIKELKKLKAAGNLTKETWLAGIAEGINTDSSLGKLEDTLGTKFEKLTEQLKLRVAPLGHSILDTFLAGLMPTKDTEGGLSDFGNSVSTKVLSLYAGAARLMGVGGYASEAYYQQLMATISEKEKAAKIRILQKSKANWEGVLASPFSDPAAIEDAKKKIESVNQKLQVAMLGDRDPANDAVTLSMGASLGKLFAKGVKQGIEVSKADIARTANAILRADGSHQVRMALLGSDGSDSGKTRQNQEQTRYLREQISLQRKYFNEQLSLYADDADKTADIQKERNDTLSRLDTELKVHVIQSQKELADIERKQNEERRRNLIDYKSIELRAISDRLNTKTRLIEEQIDKEGGLDGSRFQELIALTQTSYQRINQITNESYDLQLQDEALTAQQRTNLLKQKFEEEITLRENNAAQVREINNRAAEAFRNNIERQIQLSQRLYGQRADAFRQIPGTFFSADTFTSKSAAGFQDIVSGGNLRAELADALAKQNAAKARLEQSFKDNLSPETRTLLGDQYNDLIGKTDLAMKAFDAFTGRIPRQYQEIAKLGTELTKTAGGYERFDEIAAKGLKAAHLLEISGLQAEIDSVKDLAPTAETSRRLKDLNNDLVALQLRHHAEDAELFSRSLVGLRETLNLTRSGDIGISNAFGAVAEKSVLSEMIAGYTEIAVLKERISRSSEIQALDLEKAALNDLIELERTRTQVLIESQRTVQYRMAMQLAQLPTYRAQLTGFLGDLPTTLADVWGQTLQNFDGTWSGFLTTLKENFFRTVQEMLAELLRAQLIRGLTGLFTSLFGGMIGGGAAGVGAGAHASVGDIFGGFHADGGVPPMNRVSVVGENGPELFVPNVGGRILSNADSRAALGGGGNTNILHQHFHADRQTGMFSKPSAVQAANAAAGAFQQTSSGRRS